MLSSGLVIGQLRVRAQQSVVQRVLDMTTLKSHFLILGELIPQ
jgi:hypothetical protein